MSKLANINNESCPIKLLLAGRYKNRSPLGQSLKNIRVFARITLREMANAMNVKASTISEWEWGNETPDLGQIADYLRFCLEHIRQAKTALTIHRIHGGSFFLSAICRISVLLPRGGKP